MQIESEISEVKHRRDDSPVEDDFSAKPDAESFEVRMYRAGYFHLHISSLLGIYLEVNLHFG